MQYVINEIGIETLLGDGTPEPMYPIVLYPITSVLLQLGKWMEIGNETVFKYQGITDPSQKTSILSALEYMDKQQLSMPGDTEALFAATVFIREVANLKDFTARGIHATPGRLTLSIIPGKGDLAGKIPFDPPSWFPKTMRENWKKMNPTSLQIYLNEKVEMALLEYDKKLYGVIIPFRKLPGLIRQQMHTIAKDDLEWQKKFSDDHFSQHRRWPRS